MLNDSIKIHDKFQFEVKLSYLLKDSSWSEFDFESYTFLPGSLGINKFTYTSEDFYRDVKHLIRFRAPEFSFPKLLSSQHSPLIRLQKLLNTKGIPAFEIIEYDIKIFCNVARRTVKNEFLILDSLPDINENHIKSFLSNITELENKFIELKIKVENSGLPEEYQKLFNLADEYICILFQNYGFDVLEKFNTKIFTKNAILRHELLEFIEKKVNRQKEKNYPSIPKENDDNEEFFYRKSIFKKYFTSPLFLKPKFNKESGRIEQLIFSLAAGIAMFFAVMFTVIGGWGLQMGNTSSTVIFMIVVGYMFKDRIKELGRIYISQTILKKLYDRKWNLFIQGNKRKMGYSKEMFYFMSENDLPKQIQKIRNAETLIPVQDESIKQRVLYYKKSLKLKSNLKKSAFNNYSITRMNDILRFNVRSFIRNMDEEEKQLYILKNNDYYQTEGERVYHINMVIKLSSNLSHVYRRVRVILTQNGIKRLETVDVENFLMN